MHRLRVVEDNLVVLVVATTVVGLVAPRTGELLVEGVAPLLALLMLVVAMTFDLDQLRAVLRAPGIVLLATVLVYGAASLLAVGLAAVSYGSGPLWLGVILLGVLPTDVSSPLLVWIARGDVALATVCNAVTTALAPVVVPALFLAYTGIELDVPVGVLVGELALTVLVPTIVGVALRTRWPDRIEPVEPLLSATGACSYLALLLAVVGANAAEVLADPSVTLGLAGVLLALNAGGYLLAGLASPLLRSRPARAAMLFTVSKKEFSIAALVVFSAGLPSEVALPAVVYAVVQMVTSPAVARLVARRGEVLR